MHEYKVSVIPMSGFYTIKSNGYYNVRMKLCIKPENLKSAF